ncbi:MAG: hypothetical protein M3N54_12535 [Acidobacteriota bacterium]|nr:hypothetical protein [Acidobacteriota bacterium]
MLRSRNAPAPGLPIVTLAQPLSTPESTRQNLEGLLIGMIEVVNRLAKDLEAIRKLMDLT